MGLQLDEDDAAPEMRSFARPVSIQRQNRQRGWWEPLEDVKDQLECILLWPSGSHKTKPMQTKGASPARSARETGKNMPPTAANRLARSLAQAIASTSASELHRDRRQSVSTSAEAAALQLRPRRARKDVSVRNPGRAGLTGLGPLEGSPALAGCCVTVLQGSPCPPPGWEARVPRTAACPAGVHRKHGVAPCLSAKPPTSTANTSCPFRFLF